MKKKIVALFLAAVMLFAFAACGTTSSNQTYKVDGKDIKAFSGTNVRLFAYLESATSVKFQGYSDSAAAYVYTVPDSSADTLISAYVSDLVKSGVLLDKYYNLTGIKAILDKLPGLDKFDVDGLDYNFLLNFAQNNAVLIVKLKLGLVDCVVVIPDVAQAVSTLNPIMDTIKKLTPAK